MASWDRRLAVASARPLIRGPRADGGGAPLPLDVPGGAEGSLVAALAVSSDLVAVLDGELRVRWCNEAFASVAPAAGEGGHLSDVLDEGSYDRFVSSVRPVLDRAGRWRGVLGLAAPAAAGSGPAEGGLPVSVVVVDPPADAGSERGVVVVVARAAHDIVLPPVPGEPGGGAGDEVPPVDPVTGLGTPAEARRVLADVLTGSGHGGAVVLLVGLDQLRAVNEHLGREAGDRVLQVCAARLGETVPAGSTVTRGVGDQFIVVLPGAGPADGLTQAICVRDALTAPIALAEASGAAPYVITASVGLAVAPSAGGEPDAAARADSIVRDAERALAQAKASGRDRIEVYTDDLGRDAVRRLTQGQVLRRALAADDVVLHYQPVVDVATGEVFGAEALLRLRPDHGLAGTAAELVAAAESSGLIDRLGARVIDLTCRQLASWPAPTGDGHGLLLSVNVAPRQLSDPELPAHVRAALEATGADARRLCLEITESTLIGADDVVDEVVGSLRDLGVNVGLDDFGAGASSLAYLKRFPLDFVKIHRSLVAGLGHSDRDAAIVRATVELAHELGMSVVAVGVESSRQLDRLRALGCDRAQGHLFSPALPVGELTDWLRTG